MKDLVIFNVNFKKIDDNYFSNYGGKNYFENYLKYTSSPKQVVKDLIYNGITFKTILDIGCASGEVVRDFRRLGLEAYGIENNMEILGRCVVPEFCTQGDMSDLSSIKDKSIELIYCNALMYVFPTEILNVLLEFNRIASKAVYLCCPFLGSTSLAHDPYRVFLAKESWWDKQFKEANFFKVSDNIYSIC